MAAPETEMEIDRLLIEVAGVARAEHDEIQRASFVDPVTHEWTPEELRGLTSAALERLRAGAPIRDRLLAPVRSAPLPAIGASRRVGAPLRSRIALAAACASAMALVVVRSWHDSESQVTPLAPEPQASEAPSGAYAETHRRGALAGAEPPSLVMRAPPRAPPVDSRSSGSKTADAEGIGPNPLFPLEMEVTNPYLADAGPSTWREASQSLVPRPGSKSGSANNDPDRARASDFESQVLVARHALLSARAKVYFDQADAIDARVEAERRRGLTDNHRMVIDLREQSAELRAKARRILEGAPDEDDADTPRTGDARRP